MHKKRILFFGGAFFSSKWQLELGEHRGRQEVSRSNVFFSKAERTRTAERKPVVLRLVLSLKEEEN